MQYVCLFQENLTGVTDIHFFCRTKHDFLRLRKPHKKTLLNILLLEKINQQK